MNYNYDSVSYSTVKTELKLVSSYSYQIVTQKCCARKEQYL